MSTVSVNAVVSEAGGPPRLTELLVADGHPIVREGLRAMLARLENVVVVGEAESGQVVLDLLGRHRPDLILMDARMPGIDGVEVTRRIGAAHPRGRVIILADESDTGLLWEALEAGAHGFILKDTTGADLAGVLREVIEGGTFVDPRVAPAFLRPLSRPHGSDVLSSREREVLQMLADGLSNRDVSERLVLSVETVKTHVKHILAKLKAEHRTQAVAIAIRQSIIR